MCVLNLIIFILTDAILANGDELCMCGVCVCVCDLRVTIHAKCVVIVNRNKGINLPPSSSVG